jgi:hypothetical protein
MTELFPRVSRNSRRRVRGRALVTLAAAMCAALTLAWPARGRALRGCGDVFTLSSSVNNITAIDCETAETKAGRSALQNVQNAAAGYVCPASCPTLVQVTAPQVISDSCSSYNGSAYGSATAQGTYVCQ